MITRTSHTTADVERRSIRKRMRQLQLRSSSYHQHQHTLVDTGKRNINRGFLLIFFPTLYERRRMMNLFILLHRSHPVRAIGFSNCVQASESAQPASRAARDSLHTTTQEHSRFCV